MGRIYLEHISKTFDDRKILDDITYRFYDSNVYLIYGLTGSGKSTLLSIINDKKSDLGNVSYEGIIKTDLSYCCKNDLIENLTGIENLYFVSKDKNKIKYISKLLKIEDILVKQVSTYSNGEYQRLSFARLYLENKPVMLLDEPTASLDIDNKKIIYDTLYEIKKNKIIIIVSHDCEDDRFIKLHLLNNKLIEENNNIINNNEIEHINNKINYKFKTWKNLFIDIFKYNFFKCLLTFILLIIISFISFVTTNLKDNREEVVNEINSTQWINSDIYDDIDYFIYDDSKYKELYFSKDNAFNFNDSKVIATKDHELINQRVLTTKEYVINKYTTGLINIPSNKQLNIYNEYIAEQFIDFDNSTDLNINEIEVDVYNCNLNNNISNNVVKSEYPILCKTFNVKKINYLEDNNDKRIIIRLSNSYKDYIKDNVFEINFNINKKGCIDNSLINKDNVFSYQTIRNKYSDSYHLYLICKLCTIINTCLIFFTIGAVLILYYGIEHKYEHNKIILRSLRVNEIYINSFYLIYEILNLLFILIMSIIFINNKDKINDIFFNSTIFIVKDIGFNYVVMFMILIVIIIPIIFSFKKKSIFKIEKIQ